MSDHNKNRNSGKAGKKTISKKIFAKPKISPVPIKASTGPDKLSDKQFYSLNLLTKPWFRLQLRQVPRLAEGLFERWYLDSIGMHGAHKNCKRKRTLFRKERERFQGKAKFIDSLIKEKEYGRKISHMIERSLKML